MRCVGSAREGEDAEEFETQNVLAILRWDGSCSWSTYVTHTSSHCRMNIAWFPLDTQRCSLKFESWSMTSKEMNMTTLRDPNQDPIDLNQYEDSGEWELVGKCCHHILVRGVIGV